MSIKNDAGISSALLQAIQQSIAAASVDANAKSVLICGEDGQSVILMRPSSASGMQQGIYVQNSSVGGAGVIGGVRTVADDGGGRHIVVTTSDGRDDNSVGYDVKTAPKSVIDYPHQQLVVTTASGERHLVVTTNASCQQLLSTSQSSTGDGRHDDNYVVIGTIDAGDDARDNDDDSSQQRQGNMAVVNVKVARARSQQRMRSGATTSVSTPQEISHVDHADPGQRIVYLTSQMESDGIPQSETETTEVVIAANDAENAARKFRFQGPDGQIYVLAESKEDDEDSQSEFCVNANPHGSPAARPQQDTEWSSYVNQFADKGPCPVCGDKVSGYHYGIFSCESCKGFFKRSIQNNKAFTCCRGGDCAVELANRKKCAACRFKKCLDCGMKLDAVRNDRSRGGRSIYEGCSPRPVKNAAKMLGGKSARSPVQATATKKSRWAEAADAVGAPLVQSQLLQMLSQGRAPRAAVPPLMTDIMNLESLLCEDDDDDVGVGENDDNLYTSLLQIADQRLYKIVRWARSLPDFAVISTDDQIALLQNAWAELLCLDCCWRSLQTPNEIKLSYSKSIDANAARALNADDIFQRVLQLRDHLQRIQMDMHEFACLKVLVLMSPDIKGLKDLERVREYQECVTDALNVYITTHYPKSPTKFGDLLLRLSEIAKTSALCKELLSRRDLPAEVSSFSLLCELLRTPCQNG